MLIEPTENHLEPAGMHIAPGLYESTLIRCQEISRGSKIRLRFTVEVSCSGGTCRIPYETSAELRPQTKLGLLTESVLGRPASDFSLKDPLDTTALLNKPVSVAIDFDGRFGRENRPVISCFLRTDLV